MHICCYLIDVEMDWLALSGPQKLYLRMSNSRGGRISYTDTSSKVDHCCCYKVPDVSRIYGLAQKVCFAIVS